MIKDILLIKVDIVLTVLSKTEKKCVPFNPTHT